MKHNATYISLSLFILSYISFSNCADTLEKKEVSSNTPSPVIAYLPPSKDSNLKKCLLWRLSNPIYINDKEGKEKKLDPIFPTEFACRIIDLCIIEGTSPIINGIIKATKDHPSDSLDVIKDAWGIEYTEGLRMGDEYRKRLETILSFNPKNSDSYCLSEPNDKDTKDTPDKRSREMKKMILSHMTLSLAGDKMDLLLPSEWEQTYQGLVAYPPADFDKSNPYDHMMHLITLLDETDQTICLFDHSVDHEHYFSNKKQIDVTFPIFIVNYKTYHHKKSSSSTRIQRSNWHVAAEAELTLPGSS